jgi:hypothetical protein
MPASWNSDQITDSELLMKIRFTHMADGGHNICAPTARHAPSAPLGTGAGVMQEIRQWRTEAKGRGLRALASGHKPILHWAYPPWRAHSLAQRVLALPGYVGMKQQ